MTGGRAGLAVGGLSAVAVLTPLVVRPGFTLSYDMVFVPRPALDRGLLGLGTGVARAVPSDLLVALASRVVTGEVVQRLVLLGIVVLGAWGAARLQDRALPGAVTAAAWVWNPMTYERLVLGQWALLVSFAALPWAVAAARALRERGRWRGLLVALVVAGCGSPAGGLLVAVVAVVVVAWPGAPRRNVWLAAGAAVVAVLPWAVPSLLRPGGVPGDVTGLAVFAPRADSALGTVGSVLTLGGVWNAEVAPPGRELVLTAVLSVALVLAAVGGLRGLPLLAPLLTVSLVGLVVGLAPVLPGADAVVRLLVRHVPGGALLRDGQKFAAPWLLLLALGLGRTAGLVQDRVREVGARRLFAGVLLLLPVATVPALAWGASGRLTPVRYPADWRALPGHVGAGPVLVLPLSTYRAPAWNHGRTVLDPAPRFVGGTVVVADDLVVDRSVVPGEDPLVRRVQPVLSGAGPLAGPLAADGIRWVVVERSEVGAAPLAGRLAGAQLVDDGSVLSVWRLPGPQRLDADGPPVAPVVAGDLAVVAALGLAAVRRPGRRP